MASEDAIDSIKLDKNIIDEQRERLQLNSPLKFEKGRIDGDMIDKLIELVTLPFDASAITKDNTGDFVAKRVPYIIQLARMHEIFGPSHLKFEHTVAEFEEEKLTDNSIFHYKTYVTLKIGNYTPYIDYQGKPDSNFVTYYEASGIGYYNDKNRGTAEKNSFSNGAKECFKQMGMLRYLYAADDETPKPDVQIANVELLSNIIIYPTSTVYAKVAGRDIETDKTVELLVFRYNTMNIDQEKLTTTINEIKKQLVKGSIVNIEYVQREYNGNIQYLIYKLQLEKGRMK
jgi:hypothetical protein